MDFSIAWQKIVQMGHDFMALLPNLIIGLVVFVGFVFVARGVQSLVERVVANRHQSQSLKLLLSRLKTGAIFSATYSRSPMRCMW